MDAGANPEKAAGGSESAAHPSDVSKESAASSDIPTIDSPGIVPAQDEPAEARPAAVKAAPMTALIVASPRFDGAANRASAHARGWHLPKVSHLAITILIAAGVGAAAGSLGTFAVTQALTAPQVAETHTLRETVTHLRAELAGTKAGAEAATKASAGQLARMAERLERAEKQRVAMTPPATVPAARSPVAANTTAAPNEVTGSIPTPRPSPLGFKRDAVPPVIIPDWVLRDVHGGTAYIQSREGMMEVQVGDGLPNGGKVQSIRHENGHWVVFTTRGIVVMR